MGGSRLRTPARSRIRRPARPVPQAPDGAEGAPRARLGAAVAVAGLVGAAVLGLHTRPFLLSRLRVAGLRQVSVAEVQADLAVPAGAYTWQLRPWVLEARLERDPLVRRATVRVLWPGGLQVSLVERAPAALLLSGAQAWEVDAHGRLLRALPAPAAQAGQPVPGVGRPVPLVTGVSLPAPQAGQVVEAPALGGALAVAEALGGTYPSLVSEVTVTSAGAVGLVLRGGVPVLYGDGSAARLKTQELLGALAYFQQRGEKVGSCDVSSTRTPACTLAGPGAAATSAGAPGPSGTASAGTAAKAGA